MIGVNRSAAGIEHGAIGNLVATATAPIDHRIGPLADNGGPALTHALRADSPAIDAGDPAFAPPPAFDQCGVVRNVDGNADGIPTVDIGAFEFVLLGDMDGDGDVDFDDIDDLVLGLNNPQEYENAYGLSPALRGDIDLSGALDFDDIDDFVLRLSGEAVREAVFGRSASANGDQDPDFGITPGVAASGRKKKS